MNKTEKKLDKAIIKALTKACETSKDLVHGFEWLTHSVNFADFPATLRITCVFDTEDSKQQAMQDKLNVKIIVTIEKDLADVGIKCKQIDRHISFDSEQACRLEHGGNWQLRLATH